LKERQLFDDGREVTRPVRVEQLRPDCDPSSLVTSEPAHCSRFAWSGREPGIVVPNSRPNRTD